MKSELLPFEALEKNSQKSNKIAVFSLGACLTFFVEQVCLNQDQNLFTIVITSAVIWCHKYSWQNRSILIVTIFTKSFTPRPEPTLLTFTSLLHAVLHREPSNWHLSTPTFALRGNYLLVLRKNPQKCWSKRKFAMSYISRYAVLHHVFRYRTRVVKVLYVTFKCSVFIFLVFSACLIRLHRAWTLSCGHVFSTLRGITPLSLHQSTNLSTSVAIAQLPNSIFLRMKEDIKS